MATASVPAGASAAPDHSAAFRRRRFLNWFPMGLTYAFLYMGRYNLNVAKSALGNLMTNEDFGLIFGVGTVVYALSFLLNGPLTDRIGGKRGILIASIGAGITNLVMGFYLSHTVGAGTVDPKTLRLVFVFLYATNMYFQSFAAVAIVKVNQPWFHVRERGGFSGIFGTMISSGIFFAYTVNGWVLDFVAKGKEATARTLEARWVFFGPGALLLTMAVIEFVLLRDKPSDANLEDFDTGDAVITEGDEPALTVMKRVLFHPVILTIALIELCTGVVRNGVMQWYPFFVRDVFSLPSAHTLNNGSWGSPLTTIVPFFVAAFVLFFVASRLAGKAKGVTYSIGGVLFLIPFLQGGWGGIQMVAGVVGGIVAGYVSDIFFQSRRAPAAGGLYAVMIACTIGMVFSLGTATTTLEVGDGKVTMPGDRIVSVNGVAVSTWVEARRAFACVPVACAGEAKWDVKACLCSTAPDETMPAPALSATIPLEIVRNGAPMHLDVADPGVKVDAAKGTIAAKFRAGDSRSLPGQPKLTVSPYLLGGLVFLMSLCVIGTHGLLSGTATMDFGGKKAAATAVGMIDGFVYLGTAIQSFSLGKLTTMSWHYWPMFLVPWTILGFALCTRVWNAKPTPKTA